MLSFFKPYLKAVGGFVTAVLTNAFTDLYIYHQPYPATWGDALRWVLSIAGTTAAVYWLPYLPKSAKASVTETPAASSQPAAPVQPSPGLGGSAEPFLTGRPPEPQHGQHEKPE